jgi:hypothetical protein
VYSASPGQPHQVVPSLRVYTSILSIAPPPPPPLHGRCRVVAAYESIRCICLIVYVCFIVSHKLPAPSGIRSSLHGLAAAELVLVHVVYEWIESYLGAQ